MQNLAPKTLALTFLVAAALPAQSTRTLPRNKATIEGPKALLVPLRHAPARIQCGYAKDATGWTRPTVISALTARADIKAYLTKAMSLDVQVLLSSRGCNPAASGTSFAANHGVDRRIFLRRRTITFPAFPRQAIRRPFDIVLKGDAVFTAIDPQLLVDWATYTPSNVMHANFDVDADFAQTLGQLGSIVHYGTACSPSSFRTFIDGNNITQTLKTSGNTGSPGDLALAWISPKRSNISLGGGCTLYADFTAPGTLVYPTALATAGASGAVDFIWGRVPDALGGRRVRTQMLAIAPTLQRRWSRGTEITFGNQRPEYVTGHRYNFGLGTRSFDPDKGAPLFGGAGTAIIFRID